MSGGPTPAQNNAENLLDIDFDGAAPASAQKEPTSDSTGLEDLGGMSSSLDAPSGQQTTDPAGPAPRSDLDDLMGVFGNGQAAGPSNGTADLMNGFASLDMGAGNQPPPSGQQLGQKGGGRRTMKISLVFSSRIF